MERLNSIILGISNAFNSLIEILSFIIEFLISLIKFIVLAFGTLFNYLGRLFDSILNENFFSVIGDGFNNLSLFIGGYWASIFAVLFIVAFGLIIFGFIIRFMKGSVNYNSVLKKYSKLPKN